MNPGEAGLGLASLQHSEEACTDVNRRLLDHLRALFLVPPLFRPSCCDVHRRLLGHLLALCLVPPLFGPVRFLALGGAIHRDSARDRSGASAWGG